MSVCEAVSNEILEIYSHVFLYQTKSQAYQHSVEVGVRMKKVEGMWADFATQTPIVHSTPQFCMEKMKSCVQVWMRILIWCTGARQLVSFYHFCLFLLRHPSYSCWETFLLGTNLPFEVEWEKVEQGSLKGGFALEKVSQQLCKTECGLLLNNPILLIRSSKLWGGFVSTTRNLLTLLVV